MSFNIVAAIAANGVIGRENKLPWHLPADLAHFYHLVYQKPVVMGRKTYESIGHLIKDSPNIILSQDTSYQIAGGKVCHLVAEVLELCSPEMEVMIIGGAEIYQQFLPYVTTMYLTFIEQKFAGDAYFPVWQPNEWELIERSKVYFDLFSYFFVTVQRQQFPPI